MYRYYSVRCAIIYTWARTRVRIRIRYMFGTRVRIARSYVQEECSSSESSSYFQYYIYQISHITYIKYHSITYIKYHISHITYHVTTSYHVITYHTISEFKISISYQHIFNNILFEIVESMNLHSDNDASSDNDAVNDEDDEDQIEDAEIEERPISLLQSGNKRSTRQSKARTTKPQTAAEKRRKLENQQKLIEFTNVRPHQYRLEVPMEDRISTVDFPVLQKFPPVSGTQELSVIWKHFKTIPNLPNHASCNYCREDALEHNDDLSIEWAIPYGKEKSTGRLRKHLSRHHRNIKISDPTLQRNNMLTYADTSKYQTTFHQSTLKWLVMTYTSFSMVNDDSYRSMISAASLGKAPVLDRNTVSTKVVEQAEFLKRQASKMIKDGIPRGEDRLRVWKAVHEGCMELEENAQVLQGAGIANKVAVADNIAVTSRVAKRIPEWLQNVLRCESDGSDDEIHSQDQLPQLEKSAVIDREVDEYRTREKQIDMFDTWNPEQKTGTYSDPLAWWKEHEKIYPNLSKLARRVLAIPATSAPSERLFSVAGLTISNSRASLLPENAEAVIFLHDNWGKIENWMQLQGNA